MRKIPKAMHRLLTSNSFSPSGTRIYPVDCRYWSKRLPTERISFNAVFLSTFWTAFFGFSEIFYDFSVPLKAGSFGCISSFSIFPWPPWLFSLISQVLHSGFCTILGLKCNLLGITLFCQVSEYQTSQLLQASYAARARRNCSQRCNIERRADD